MDMDDVQWVFTYHPPTETQIPVYELIRAQGRRFAEIIMLVCPDNGDREVAFGKLRETVMWANASIACDNLPYADGRDVYEMTLDEGEGGEFVLDPTWNWPDLPVVSATWEQWVEVGLAKGRLRVVEPGAHEAVRVALFEGLRAGGRVIEDFRLDEPSA